MSGGATAHLRRLQGELARRRLDAALILTRPATQWLTGFRGTSSFTLVTPRSVLFLTDARYIEAARAELRGMRVVLQRLDVDRQLGTLLRQRGIRRLGLEAAIPHEQWRWVRRLCPPGVRLVDVTPALRRLRSVKDAEEIAGIRRAVALTDEVFHDLVVWLRGRLRRGAPTEREVALWLRRAFEERGAEGPSFPPIVATGANSARPHATPGDRPVRRGAFLLVDFGLVLGGLCSDLTRTLAVGDVSARHRRIHEIVRQAQAAGTAAIRAGARKRDVDAAARQVIAEAGHGKHFGHGLGHGVGVEIHEEPRLNQTARGRLAAGQVVTVEPGIYLPGLGGVRIEDMVVVREGGPEVLTQAPRELIVL